MRTYPTSNQTRVAVSVRQHGRQRPSARQAAPVSAASSAVTCHTGGACSSFSPDAKGPPDLEVRQPEVIALTITITRAAQHVISGGRFEPVCSSARTMHPHAGPTATTTVRVDEQTKSSKAPTPALLGLRLPLLLHTCLERDDDVAALADEHEQERAQA